MAACAEAHPSGLHLSLSWSHSASEKEAMWGPLAGAWTAGLTAVGSGVKEWSI